MAANTRTQKKAPNKITPHGDQNPTIENRRRKGSNQTRKDCSRDENETLLCVVGHDPSFRKEVYRILYPDYRIELFDSGRAFLSRRIHQGPCCLVIDNHLPDLCGNRLLEILSTEGRSDQVIFVSGNSDIPTCAQAFRAGAVDFLTKPLKNAELLRAVERGIQRSMQIFRIRQARVAAQKLLDQLTPRERDVLGFVIVGRLNKVIAAELGITEKMVKKHRGHFMKKLKISSVAELIWFCLRSQLEPAFFDGGPRSPIQPLAEFLSLSRNQKVTPARE